MFGNNTQKNNESIQSFVGIDIGTYAIKVVQVRRDNDQIHLETYGELEMAAYDSLPHGSVTNLGEQKMVQAIRELFVAARVTSTNVVFSIPITSCFISDIDIPKVSDEELKSIIPIEARKYLPIPVSEVKINYWRTAVNPKNVDTKDNVIIAAVKNDTLELYQRYGKALGIKNISFEIESLSGARVSVKGFEKNEPILFLDIGGKVSSLTFIHEGIVKATNVIQNGSYENTSQTAKVLGIGIDVAEEAKRLFGYLGDQSSPHLSEVIGLSSYPLFDELTHLSLKYERMYNVNINKIIISGGGSLIPGVKDFASEFLKKEILLAKPFKNLVLPENFKKIAIDIEQKYTVATGLALKNII